VGTFLKLFVVTGRYFVHPFTGFTFAAVRALVDSGRKFSVFSTALLESCWRAARWCSRTNSAVAIRRGRFYELQKLRE
jgi:hypothetical protein